MRNEPKPLDRETAMRCYALRDRLSNMDGMVTLHYFKRNGAKSSTTGTVQFFNGADGMDTMSVTLDSPEKGSRTINLVGVFDFYEG